MAVRIAVGNLITNAWLVPNADNDAYPVTHLKSPERPFLPFKIGVAAGQVVIDYYSAVPRNAWLVVHTNVLQFRVESDDARTFDSAGGSPQYDSTLKTIPRYWNGRYGYLLQAGQTITRRYDRFSWPSQQPADAAALFRWGGLFPCLLEVVPFDPAWEPDVGRDDAAEFVGAGNWDEEIQHDDPATVIRLPLQAQLSLADSLASDPVRLWMDLQHRIAAGGIAVVSLSDTDPTQAWVVKRRTLQPRWKTAPLSTGDYELKEVIGGDHAEASNDVPVDEMSAWGNALFSRSSATQCQLGLGDIPLKVNGVWVRRAITAAITTGLTNGGLAANTLYYAYAYDDSGVTKGELVATAPTQDSGHGVYVKSSDAARTLVGMVVTDGSSQFVDTDTRRTVRSWFNDNGVSTINYFTAARTRASGTIAEIHSEIRCLLALWTGEVVLLSFAAVISSNTAGEGANTTIGVVGGTLTSMPSASQALITETMSAIGEVGASASPYTRFAGADGLVTLTLNGGTSTGGGGGSGTTTWVQSGTFLSVTALGRRR